MEHREKQLLIEKKKQRKNLANVCVYGSDVQSSLF